jgi:hypothetical protein
MSAKQAAEARAERECLKMRHLGAKDDRGVAPKALSRRLNF